MTEKEIMQQREYSIVKANDLIQKTRFNLTTQEQKIILFLISRVKPDDKELLEQEFDIKEFCQVCGIDFANGKNYKNLKDTIKKLGDKSCWLETDNKKEFTLFRWIVYSNIVVGNGTIKIQLHKFLEPYLIGLKERFTKYSLYYTLPMKSQYSIRLYELFKSYEYKKSIKFEIEDLKEKLQATVYKRFQDFRRKVLEIGINEINKFSDIEITYVLEKQSRSYKYITFKIKFKTEIMERLKIFENVEQIINKKKS